MIHGYKLTTISRYGWEMSFEYGAEEAIARTSWCEDAEHALVSADIALELLASNDLYTSTQASDMCS